MANSNTAQKSYFLGSDEAVSAKTSSPTQNAKPISPQIVNRQAPVTTAQVTKRSPLNEQLNALASLIANITESYTTTIFRAKGRNLELAAVHTLSREFIDDCSIAFGCGLVGWTAENAVRISVCPFEHDSTTLLYYSAEQDLKSFIAVPILACDNSLLGVIACDSKKSYAFAKITEKILTDCAKQAATLIDLYKQLGAKKYEEPLDQDALQAFVDSLRSVESEDALLEKAANIPLTLISRDALFVVTSDTDDIKGSVYTSRDKTSPTGNHLLETICRHKKILCSDRSIHVSALNDIQNRSFLSVPFRCLGRDAGSFNALSRPGLSFDARGIEALEATAKAVGERLEYLRLKGMLYSSKETVGLLPWSVFQRRSQHFIEQSLAENTGVSLMRFHLSNLLELEKIGGTETAASMLQQLMRLIDQVKPGGSISGYLHGSHVVLVLLSEEVEQTRRRLSRLLERMCSTPDAHGSAHDAAALRLLREGLREATANTAQHGTTINKLLQTTVGILSSTNGGAQIEEVTNASRW